jgi:tetratricopeptide (TPR) repeat protein
MIYTLPRCSPAFASLAVLMLALPVIGIAKELPSAEPIPISLIERGHYKRARAVVEEHYRSNPQNPETIWLMSRVKLVFHDFDAALSFAEKALSADPDNLHYHLQVASAAAGLIPNVNLMRKVSLGMQLRKEIDAAVALDPNNIEALLFLMDFYLNAPSVIGGDLTKARAAADRIMRLDPVQGFHAQAALAKLERRWDKIESFYLQAVKMQPRNFETHQKLADLYVNQKKLDEAEKHAREAIRIDSGRVSAHLSLITVLIDQNKMTELDLALKEAEKAVPDNLAPYYMSVARCFERQMVPPNGYAYLRKYLTQEPEPGMPTHADTHRLIGNLFYAAGRKDVAISELRLALELDPNSPAKQDLKKMR